MDFLEQVSNFLCDLIEYIDKENCTQAEYPNLTIFLNNTFNEGDPHKIKEFLRLINKVSNHHHRSSDFFNKIERIILTFQIQIKQSLTNFEIFKIFNRNKRILLFLVNNSMITFDQSIVDEIISPKFSNSKIVQFFFNETKLFLSERKMQEIEKEVNSYDLEYFDENREIGENEQIICKFIRNDSIDDFVKYVTQTNYSINKTIQTSIFETNRFLLKNNPTLIEYAAFFGSIQIFRYLFMNNAVLSSSLWMYAIRGRNPEIIHFLEDKKILPADETYMQCFVESVKCFHNEIARYINDNYVEIDDKIDYLNYNSFECVFKFRNYFFFPKNSLNSAHAFYYMCKYDYPFLVKTVMISDKVNINEVIIIQKNNLFIL